MGQEFKSLFPLDTKRFLWLIVITFAVILAFQYIELPYGNFLFSTSNIPPSGSSSFQITDPPSKSQTPDNVTTLDQANSYGGYALKIENGTRVSMEKDNEPNLGVALKPGGESNMFLGSNESDKGFMVDSTKKLDDELMTLTEEERGQSSYNKNMGVNNFTRSSGEKNITLLSEHESGSAYINSTAPSPATAPTYQTPSISPPTEERKNITTPAPELPNDSITPSVSKDNTTTSKNESLWSSQNDVNTVDKNSSINVVHDENKGSSTRIHEVLSISEMNTLFLQSHASYRSLRPRWSSAADQELLQARSEIENARTIKNDPSLYAPVYRNVSMFRRSYDIMEERLKVYIYREGARPIMHTPFLRGIYASEGWFMKLMEASNRFVTKDPRKAHMFYLPFSSRMLEETLYVQDSHNHNNLKRYLNNYVDMIASKHPFWNRTGGADHFLVACHDWAPGETKQKMAMCIRALCNADAKEGFVFGKDASLPETYIRNFQNPKRGMGGKPASKKSTLAFFAGNMHGYVRPILLQHWENKDPDMKIFGRMPKSKGDRNYIQYMKSSKYCICAKGYEVNSPRVVEAILYECVPVIISDNFVPPFFEVLNWESFAVFVVEKDIPNLKNILLSIPAKRYLQMQMRVRKVQQHFLWHTKPVKYDVFHMILHSIWYNRVFTATSR
ncbi:probable glycosyltransferase At5g03795 isoform X1 [Prosopis cineraria]|uniref:probable glycosyltransferase At5g03795 isoform X1 n=1 Tax=Prosopis cineraria TaxID=364024 RepID=UPI00240ECADD|nr:probable glycosyltransferase At5g03795 isoform X1 [Prosopis cineraria]XP_054788483.1 probable glycosyltransferase At5g03795 isoform X1 [Prosopis cineraria]XP_054788484.1 probable glycosyltransferase At5g03795 isoform X1 [Prosopis cineraria]